VLNILSHSRNRRPRSPRWPRPDRALYLGGYRDAYLDYDACTEDTVIEILHVAEEPSLQSRCDTGYSELHAAHPLTVVLAIA
jgi:hypothetical protein